MRSLGSLLVKPAHPHLSHHASGRKYRAGSVFVMDPKAVSTPLDRNQRARLLAQAEGIERRTKLPGRRSGVLGLTGLAVLRALVLMFANKRTGICNPSYATLQKVTGFCRQTIAKALRALECVGVIRVVRRLVRGEINRGGRLSTTTLQGTNLYAFRLDGQIQIGKLLAPCARSFPKPNAMISFLFSRVHWVGGNCRRPTPSPHQSARYDGE